MSGMPRSAAPWSAALVALAVVATAGGCASDSGRPSLASASAYLDQRHDLGAEVTALCQAGTPIPDAQPYGGASHPLVFVLEWSDQAPRVLYWQPASAGTVQLVACFLPNASKTPVKTCTYRDPVGDLAVDKKLMLVSGSLRIVEARTGLQKAELSFDAGDRDCPSTSAVGGVLEVTTDWVDVADARIWDAIAAATAGDCPIVGAAKLSLALGSPVTAVQAEPDYCMFKYDSTPTPAIWQASHPFHGQDRFSVRTSPYESIASAKNDYNGSDVTVAGNAAFWTLNDELYIDRGATTLVVESIPALGNDGRGAAAAAREAAEKIAGAILSK